MVKFNKQTTLSNCGPTALLNCLKWAGKNYSIKDYKKIYKLTKTDKDGTTDNDLKNSFKSFPFWKLTNLKPNLSNVKKSLKQGQVLVLGYPEFEYKNENINVNGHYILIIEQRNNKFLVVNHVHPKFFHKVNKNTKANLMKTTTWISKKQLQYLFLPLVHEEQKDVPVLWAIKLR
jgi:hypothetical protein